MTARSISSSWCRRFADAEEVWRQAELGMIMRVKVTEVAWMMVDVDLLHNHGSGSSPRKTMRSSTRRGLSTKPWFMVCWWLLPWNWRCGSDDPSFGSAPMSAKTPSSIQPEACVKTWATKQHSARMRTAGGLVPSTRWGRDMRCFERDCATWKQRINR